MHSQHLLPRICVLLEGCPLQRTSSKSVLYYRNCMLYRDWHIEGVCIGIHYDLIQWALVMSLGVNQYIPKASLPLCQGNSINNG